MGKKRVGIIVMPPGVIVEKHEKLAVDFLAVTLGRDVTFLLASRNNGAKTPDVTMLGHKWEMKSPKGKSSRTIDNNLRNASRQSKYIVIDLRRMDGRIPTRRHLLEIERRFDDTKSIRRIIVITRHKKCIDFKR